MRKTAIVRDERYLEHRLGGFHPKSAKRLDAIYSVLDTPDWAPLFWDLPARPATRVELLQVHRFQYVDMILFTAGKGRRSLDPDTAVL